MVVLYTKRINSTLCIVWGVPLKVRRSESEAARLEGDGKQLDRGSRVASPSFPQWDRGTTPLPHRDAEKGLIAGRAVPTIEQLVRTLSAERPRRQGNGYRGSRRKRYAVGVPQTEVRNALCPLF